MCGNTLEYQKEYQAISPFELDKKGETHGNNNGSYRTDW